MTFHHDLKSNIMTEVNHIINCKLCDKEINTHDEEHAIIMYKKPSNETRKTEKMTHVCTPCIDRELGLEFLMLIQELADE